MNFVPRFTISHPITAALTRIERARGFLEAAKLSEDWIRRMGERALFLEAHHTTHIEGRRLTLEQAERPWAGERVPADHRGTHPRDPQAAIESVPGGAAQFQLVPVHPFLGGNGRASRLLSTRWESGVNRFRQVRDQDYEFAICLGVSPFDAHCWVISKEVLRQHVIGHIPQHTGRGGTDTFWLSVEAASPPPWLNPCGGRLAEVYRILRTWQTRRSRHGA